MNTWDFTLYTIAVFLIGCAFATVIITAAMANIRKNKMGTK